MRAAKNCVAFGALTAGAVGNFTLRLKCNLSKLVSSQLLQHQCIQVVTKYPAHQQTSALSRKTLRFHQFASVAKNDVRAQLHLRLFRIPTTSVQKEAKAQRHLLQENKKD